MKKTSRQHGVVVVTVDVAAVIVVAANGPGEKLKPKDLRERTGLAGGRLARIGQDRRWPTRSEPLKLPHTLLVALRPSYE